MGTSARICKVEPSGKVRSIYCNWDGYPSGVGKILKEHYTDSKKIDELLDLGNISSLKKHVSGSQYHSYDSPDHDVTIAYHRDRGESMYHAKIHDTLAEVPEEDYNYVYVDEKWHLYDSYTIKQLKQL